MFNDEHKVIDMGTGSESESGDQNPSSPVLVVSATVERRKKNRQRKERTSTRGLTLKRSPFHVLGLQGSIK